MLIDLRKKRRSRPDYVAERNAMRQVLGAMSAQQLRDFAARHSISLFSDDRQGMVIDMIGQYSSWAGDVA